MATGPTDWQNQNKDKAGLACELSPSIPRETYPNTVWCFHMSWSRLDRIEPG